MRIVALALAFVFVSVSHAETPAAPAPSAKPAVAPASPRAGWSMKELGLVPLQSGGRIKPLDSYAREVVLLVTGSRKFQGWDPVELVLSWTANPEAWENVPVILVTREDVRRQINLDDKRTRYSPAELLKNFALAQYADVMSRDPSKLSAPPNIAQGELTKKNDREEELKRVIDRLTVFHAHVAGRGWQVIPQENHQPWLPVDTKEGIGEKGLLIKQKFIDVLQAYRNADQKYFDLYVPQFRQSVESAIPGWDSSLQSKAKAEVLYNHLRPFQVGWIIYLLAGILFVARSLGAKYPVSVPLAATSAGMAFQAFGILLRCYIAGRPPVTNMYESVVWVAFGLLVFAMILYKVTRNTIAPTVGAFMASIFMIVGDSAPAMLDPSIQPLVPVLRSNYWLTIHVLTITLGYAALALTAGIANTALWQYVKPTAGSQAKVNQMNQLTYRAMQFGVVLLAAGTILGGVWADASWGRFWGWDPKEVWALIALLSYLIILHARFTGWVDQFGYAVWTIMAFMSVLMAWYGVNFILGVGLHSYGFSSGGFTFVAVFVTLQLGYVGAIAMIRRSRHAGARVSRASA